MSKVKIGRVYSTFSARHKTCPVTHLVAYTSSIRTAGTPHVFLELLQSHGKWPIIGT